MPGIRHEEICKKIVNSNLEDSLKSDLHDYCERYASVSSSFYTTITRLKSEFDTKICAYHFENIAHSLLNKKEHLMVKTLEKIKDYGRITGTDVNNIDDMKIAYFLIQSIIADKDNLNEIPHRCLKRLSQVAYEYLRNRLLEGSRCFDFVMGDKATVSDQCRTNPNYCSLESIVMLEKLDTIYNSEDIIIDDMWELYGKYGIYSIVKTLYLTVHKANYPEKEDEKQAEAVISLKAYIDILEETNVRLSLNLIDMIIESLNILSNKNWVHKHDGLFISGDIMFNILDFDNARKELEKYEGKTL